MKSVLIILLTLATTLITLGLRLGLSNEVYRNPKRIEIPKAFAVNRVLSLDGDGAYEDGFTGVNHVEVTDSESLNAINSQVTMEAWIKATEFITNEWIAIIYKGDKRTSDFSNRSYVLQLNSSGFIELASAPSDSGQISLQSQGGLIALNRWYHIAGVIDAKNDVMKIFINGAEVASRDFGKDIRLSRLPLWIGWSREEGGYGAFAGQIDEVRIWNIARTQEEIRAAMHTTLSGKEPGLVGYWRFDDDQNIAADSSPSHSDGKLIGDAHCVEAELPKQGELPIPTVISGRITTEEGKPIQDAIVRLEQDGEEIAQTQADAEGNYRLVILEKVRGSFDLFATRNELGDLRLGLRLRLGLSAAGLSAKRIETKRIETKGESRTLNLTLKEAISIEGKLMMLDDTTPHVAVVVQAVSDGKRIATVLSDEEGKYRFINLKPGQYQVRCYTTNGYVYYQSGAGWNPVVRDR